MATKTKHTDGPWMAGTEAHPHLIFSAVDDHGFIADMNHARCDWKANADLIASAPTLAARIAELEAERDRLKEAVEWATGETNASVLEARVAADGGAWWRDEVRRRAGL